MTSDFNDNYYFSIRRYPYSADMHKNPLTFKHIGNNVVLPTGPPINASGAGNNEVHNAGEVWCSMLWEVFVKLVAKHGHATAEKRMLAYVVNGLKLTPSRPTFTQARDGILTAVSTRRRRFGHREGRICKARDREGSSFATFKLDIAGRSG